MCKGRGKVEGITVEFESTVQCYRILRKAVGGQHQQEKLYRGGNTLIDFKTYDIVEQFVALGPLHCIN